MLPSMAWVELALSDDVEKWDVGERSLREMLLGYLGIGAQVLAVVFALGYLLLFLRGLAQRGRYSAEGVFGEEERADLAGEIAALEERTSGEVVVVVVERSDRHPAAHWIAAVLTLMLGSILAAPWMTWDDPLWFFCTQIAFGVLGLVGALTNLGFRRGFVTEERATEVAQEQAFQEFYLHGLHRTTGETGVLLFVSLFERRVVVLGDRGIDAVLDATDWERVEQAVLEGVRAGSLHAGLSKALGECGEVLSQHFPVGDATHDQVPNHVIVRKE